MVELRQACSGFARYRILPNLQVEVGGKVPTYDLGGSTATKLRGMWSKYGSAVKAACQRSRVPAAWFMGIMLQESGGNPRACSPCDPDWCSFWPNCEPCCAYGLMQFIDSTARSYGTTGPALLGNAPLAIDVAAQFIGDRLYGHPSRFRKPYGLDLPKVAASYNAGSARCRGVGTFGLQGQHDYSMKVVRGANTALALGIPGWVRPWPEWLPYAAGGALLGGAIGAGAGMLLSR